jgi:transposase
MSRAYSSDLRQRIVDAITQGETRRAAAATFKVSPATVFGLSSGRIERARQSRPGAVVPAAAANWALSRMPLSPR